MTDAAESSPSLDERGLPPGHPFDEREEVTPRDLRDRLAAGEAICLIDCRLPAERAITSIEPSMHIPLQMLTARQDDLAPHRDETVVVYCRVGGRSLDFARFLSQHGFKNAKSLAGGVNLWNADFGGGTIY